MPLWAIGSLLLHFPVRSLRRNTRCLQISRCCHFLLSDLSGRSDFVFMQQFKVICVFGVKYETLDYKTNISDKSHPLYLLRLRGIKEIQNTLCSLKIKQHSITACLSPQFFIVSLNYNIMWDDNTGILQLLKKPQGKIVIFE